MALLRTPQNKTEPATLDQAKNAASSGKPGILNVARAAVVRAMGNIKDDSKLGIAKNTITGLPQAGVKVASTIRDAVVKPATEALVIRPALRASEAVGTGILKAASKVTGNQDYYNRALDFSNRTKEVNIPGTRMLTGGSTTVKKPTPRQIAGEALESASYLYTPAKAAETLPLLRGGVKPWLQIGKNVAQGAVGGYMGDVGYGLQDETKTVPEALKPGLGTAIGTAVPVLGATAQAAKESADLYRSMTPAQRQAGKIRNLLVPDVPTPQENNLAQEARPRSVQPYKETGDLTTKILKDLEGKTTVSKQYILDATNRGEVKQVERELIRNILEREPATVNVSDFADKVKAELLPLEPSTLRDGRYENITLPEELRGKIAEYQERIYSSPIKTSAGDVHYSGDYPNANYFGHTRIEDMADNQTRRVIEVQSDLYQKGNLEREITAGMAPSTDAELAKALPENLRKEFNQIIKDRKAGVRKDGQVQRLSELNDIATELRGKTQKGKLQQYNDPTAHFRMVREEIKKAAEDGKTKLQFPTGETAMKIEGLGERNNWTFNTKQIGGDEAYATLKPEMLEVGKIVDNGSPWVITDVLGDGKFKAVPLREVGFTVKNDYELNRLAKEYGYLDGGEINASAVVKDGGLFPKVIEKTNNIEQFDISGKVDTNNPIYKFYEKDMGKYLKNKYNAQLVTDENGVTWYEVNVNPKLGNLPTEAFGAVAGVEIDEDGNVTFDPTKAVAGVVGMTAYNKGKRLFTQNQVDMMKVQLEIAQDLLDNHPAKELIKYTNKRTGELPEVVGGFKTAMGKKVSKFGREGDTLLTNTPYEDSETARQAVEDYKLGQQKVKELKETIKEATRQIKKEATKTVTTANKLDKSNTSLNSLYNKLRRTEESLANALQFPEAHKKAYGEDRIPIYKEKILELRNKISEKLSPNAPKETALPANYAPKTRYANEIDPVKYSSEGVPLALTAREKAILANPEGKIGTKSLQQTGKIQEPLLKPRLAEQEMPFLKTKTPPTQQEGLLAKLSKEKSKESLADLGSQQNQDRWGGKSFEEMVQKTPTPVNEKVNMLDYIRTPDRVLNKIGLGKEASLIRKQYEKYQLELPKNIEKITEWSKQVPKESNIKIFRHLDGEKILLNEKEAKVANEIKTWLSNWADRLGLPEDKRISSYITHIFEPDFIKKEFDEDLAKIVADKVPGSVYDPFLQERLGKLGYIQDTWRALDAYVKRATRKVHMDPALEQLKNASKDLEKSQFDYVKKYADRVNMRPTDADNLIDNMIKSIPGVGYKLGQRPVARLSQAGRRLVYRGLLGMNIGSALRNLSQGANTYAKLGEKYTALGYLNMLMKGTKELEEVGVLVDNFVQDRNLSATRKLWENVDKGLFFLFDRAEKINRGAAYFGGKAKALAQGLSEEQAIEAGKKMVRDTQFSFGSIDTPAVMQSDILKTITQFQSYTVKQVEFLAEMAKNKEFAGLARYALAGLAFTYSIGKLFGMKPTDLIPTFRIGVPPTLQAGWETVKAAADAPDEYGNKRDTKQKLKDVGKGFLNFIPGGAQLRKSYQGLKAVSEGGSYTAGGKLQYEIPNTTETKVRAGLFGKYSLPQAREYYNNLERPMDKEIEQFKQEQDKTRTELNKQALLELNRLEQSPETAAQEFEMIRENNPALAKKIAELKKERDLGLTDKDKEIKSLGVENGQRAKYLYAQFMKLETNEERAALWEELSKKKIISDQVEKQLRYLIKNNGSTE